MMNWKRFEEKWLWPVSRYYPVTRLRRLGWTARVLNQNSRFPVPDSNQPPPGDNICCMVSFVTLRLHLQNINIEDNGMCKIIKNIFVSMSFLVEHALHLQKCGV
jgi:hypothetical protein